MPELNFQNFGRTTLVQPISPTDTTILVSDASQFPEPDFLIRIDREIMLVTAKTVNTLTVTRAQEIGKGGSAATNHSSGSIVEHGVTAETISEIIRIPPVPEANGTYQIRVYGGSATWVRCDFG